MYLNAFSLRAECDECTAHLHISLIQNGTSLEASLIQIKIN